MRPFMKMQTDGHENKWLDITTNTSDTSENTIQA